MRKLHGYGIFCFFAVIFLVCSCGKAGSSQSRLKSYDSMEVGAFSGRHERAAANFQVSEAQTDGDYTRESPPAQETAVRKLVMRADLRLRVEDPAAVEKPLADLLEKYGAWPAQAGVYENSRSYTIRVPSVSYDAMLAELAGLGRLLMRSENAEDVTLRYYDLESRLATKRELLKTYQSYLGKAANIDEIMTVESRIADLQQEIDQTGTQFRNLTNLIDYSTISVEFTGPAGASSYSEPTLKEKMSELFSSFGSVASSAMVVLMGIIIYGVPAVLIIILLFWLFFGKIGVLRKLIRLASGKK